MAYTTIKKPSDYFNTKLYTGNGGTQSITGVGFQPDFTWIKSRSAGSWHHMGDVVRGADKRLQTNSTNAESTVTTGITSWDSDGFSLGSNGDTNASSETFASWNWKANGTGVANTDGSISSTVSANTTSGFSIVSWTSLASGSNYTVGHGLGSTPAMIIVKGRHESNSWQVYHHKNTSAPETEYLDLSTADATADYPVWNDTAPTSSVFTCGTWSGFDAGGTMIAYCFADVQGFSKFGSYTGNGNADGTFVYTGFKPAFVLLKHSSGGTDNWNLYDNKRLGYNANYSFLVPNESNAENTGATTAPLDLLSNGFKIRASTGHSNSSGETYIYMAFAEQPLVGDNPATAR